MPLQSTSRRLRSSQKLMLRLVGGLAASFVLLSALLLATGILIVDKDRRDSIPVSHRIRRLRRSFLRQTEFPERGTGM